MHDPTMYIIGGFFLCCFMIWFIRAIINDYTGSPKKSEPGKMSAPGYDMGRVGFAVTNITVALKNSGVKLPGIRSKT